MKISFIKVKNRIEKTLEIVTHWSKLKSTVMVPRLTTTRQPPWDLVSPAVHGVFKSSLTQACCKEYKVKGDCVSIALGKP